MKKNKLMVPEVVFEKAIDEAFGIKEYRAMAKFKGGISMRVSFEDVDNIKGNYKTIIGIEALPGFKKWDYGTDDVQSIKDTYLKRKLKKFVKNG